MDLHKNTKIDTRHRKAILSNQNQPQHYRTVLGFSPKYEFIRIAEREGLRLVES